MTSRNVTLVMFFKTEGVFDQLENFAMVRPESSALTTVGYAVLLLMSCAAQAQSLEEQIKGSLPRLGTVGQDFGEQKQMQQQMDLLRQQFIQQSEMVDSLERRVVQQQVALDALRRVVDLDVLSAEVGIATARNGVVIAEQGVRNNEDALLALIGQFEFNTALGTVGLLPYQEPSPSFDLSYKLARENQPDYLATQASIKQLDIDARNAKSSSRPTLDVGGSVGYNGIDRSYSGAIKDVPNGDAHNWGVDLTLSVPWGLHADRARLRSALATLRQQEARLQSIEQNLLVRVRSAVRAVDTNQQSVEINRQGTALATRQYELELARFKAGLSTSRQVLQVQDDLEQARVNELLARVNLRIAIANLHQLETSSLQQYRINLAD